MNKKEKWSIPTMEYYSAWKEEGNPAIHYNMGEPTGRNQPATERQVSRESNYVDQSASVVPGFWQFSKGDRVWHVSFLVFAPDAERRGAEPSACGVQHHLQVVSAQN